MANSNTRAGKTLLLPLLLFVSTLILVFSRLPKASAILVMWRPWADVGGIALGMTAVILAGGIDLSVGSIVTLSGTVMGLLWRDANWPIEFACLAGIATGGIAGAINGILISRGIAPLVATLATMALYSGLALSLLQSERITGFPPGLIWVGNGSWLGIPTQLVWLSCLTIVMTTLLHGTGFGRWVYSLGENRTAARFAAIPTRKADFWLYSLSGLIAGLVALSFTAKRSAVAANAGAGLELQAIACVVLGGTRVTGGTGNIGRTLLGLGVLAHLEIGLSLWGNRPIEVPVLRLALHLDANTRLIVVGLLLICAAIVNERLSPRDRELSS